MEEQEILNTQIEEVRMFLINAYQDLKLANYGLAQQQRFVNQKVAELEALKDLFSNLLEEREQQRPGSITEEDRALLQG